MKTDNEKDRLFQLKFEAGIRLPILIIAMVLTYFFLSGCAAAQERIVYETIYQDVFVPVKCDISAPTRPAREDSPALATIDIIRYTKELETVLNACRGE